MKELNELMENIYKWQNNPPVDIYLSEKINFEFKAGDKVKIVWNEDLAKTDIGYIFTLPHQDIDIYDCCIHVPSTSDDDPDEIHTHLIELLVNPLVKTIELIN